jgi:hypothetical protein
MSWRDFCQRCPGAVPEYAARGASVPVRGLGLPTKDLVHGAGKRVAYHLTVVRQFKVCVQNLGSIERVLCCPAPTNALGAVEPAPEGAFKVAVFAVQVYLFD